MAFTIHIQKKYFSRHNSSLYTLSFLHLNFMTFSVTLKFIITSLAKGGYVFGSIGLAVLSVSKQHYTKYYELCYEILWRRLGRCNEELTKFWWQSGSSNMSKWANNIIIVAAWPDCGAGNDLEALGLAFHHRGPTFINAYCQAATDMTDETKGNMGVIICLGQGGLRSPECFD